MRNLFETVSEPGDEEIVDDLVSTGDLRIERIVSRGQSSPPGFWYDQDENEWVAVLQGAGIVAFEDGEEVRLEAGDHLHIPKHRKHRVSWTAADRITVWLAVFYRS